MKKWENFEGQCTDYLTDTFGKYASFQHKGGADSTTPDILVNTNSGIEFYIEVKHSPAQCGQFVLLPDNANKKFVFSNRNHTHLNKYAELIAQHMNMDFDNYSHAGTAGREINLSHGTEIFANWIIDEYSSKDVKYFITNDFNVFPTKRLKEYFKVSAIYREKKSGSKNVGKTPMSKVDAYITDNYPIIYKRIDGPKLFVKSTKNLDKKIFVLDDQRYMFSLRDNSTYEVRGLSKTANSNVIFSVDYTGKPGMTESEIIQALK